MTKIKVVMSTGDDTLMIMQVGKYYHVEQMSEDGKIYKYPNMSYDEALKIYKDIEKNK